MGLKYFQGKWLHDKANKEQDPIAIEVKRLWSSERDPTYLGLRQAVIAETGWKQWCDLNRHRRGGKEAYYRAIYDAIHDVRV